MEEVGEVSGLLASIEESLCRDPDVDFVVAYGSLVGGDARPGSDLDIAVKFTDELSSHERFQKRCFFSGDLQQEDAPFIDVSDIEDLPLEVAYDALLGEFLCGDKEVFRKQRAEVTDSFEEEREEIRRRQRGLIDRIAEKGLHG